MSFRSTAVVLGLAALAGAAHFVPVSESDNVATQPPGMPAPFAHWPKDKKPDAVIVLTGQTWGYLRPCGCSAKQLGGLERRNNLIESLKAKGWPVSAVDLGDVPPSGGLRDQSTLKYKTAMQALKQMGYLAVGVGKYEFQNDLDWLTGNYSLQPGNEQPKLLAANLKRVSAASRAASFPGAAANDPPYIDDVVVGTVGGINVGVGAVTVGIAGTIESTDAMKEELKKLTKEFELLGNLDALKEANRKLDADPKKPALRVLLFQGSLDAAMNAAKAFPQFQLILCQSDDPLPPMRPTTVNDGKTSIVQVGHKGQFAGVAGAFKQPDGSFKIEYQLMELTEDFLTAKDPAAEAKDPILQLLQGYADQVEKDGFLKEFTDKKQQHNAQIRYLGGKLTYAGSASCKACHPQEFTVWDKSKHAEAMKFLEDPKYANRPTKRQFDPECVVCHTVGLEFQSGFESKGKTPNLAHVGCESCHGPGSGHVAAPDNKALYEYLSPWKTKPGDKLPAKDLIEKIAKTDKLQRAGLEGKFSTSESMVVQNAIKACMGCHDPENDPKFDLYEYIPKIWHSGFKAKTGAGLPPGVGK